jgi:transcriptional regulator with PAS, ATPase and Fis domain
MDLSMIPETVPEICLGAPSPQLVENVRRVCARKGIGEIGLFVAVLDEALPVGRLLQERGAKILLSRKGTADVLDKNMDIQVVKINTTMNDYLRHIDLMKKHKGRIGIVEYYTFMPELKKLCRYIGINDALLYSYDGMENYERVVQEAVSGEATILLGGGALLPVVAKQMNVPHTVVENTEESIEHALDVAMQLLHVRHEEEKKRIYYRLMSERYSTVLRLTHDAVLAIDGTGIVTVANPVALSILRRKEDECVGRHIDSIFPQLEFRRLAVRQKMEMDKVVEREHKYLSVNLMPILVEGNFQGAVCTFQSVKEIQEKEQKIRMQLQQKGHVAKYDFDDIIGKSPAIMRAKEIAASYARADSNVLILGETGVGKELFAQSIHKNSPRCKGPFVAINCASLGKELLESQLFGYEEGAFTGAVRGGRAGLFEVAHGGTLFLDEIGEIPLETQIQLLRVLQEKEVRRVGGHKIIPVDVRVLCATNRDLAAEVRASRFRRDLFYRINILRLDIPPLRDRNGDIELIMKSLLRGLAPDGLRRVEARMQELLPRLSHYDWPGNVRELMGLTERIVTLSESHARGVPDEIFLGDFTDRLPTETGSFKTNAIPGRDEVQAALSASGGSRVRAARSLGISRSTLWRLMKKYGADTSET